MSQEFRFERAARHGWRAKWHGYCLDYLWLCRRGYIYRIDVGCTQLLWKGKV